MRSRCSAIAVASASLTSASLDARSLNEGPELQSAADRHRVLGGDLDRLVEVGALEDVEADDPLPGLGVGPVGDQQLALAAA